MEIVNLNTSCFAEEGITAGLNKARAALGTTAEDWEFHVCGCRGSRPVSGRRFEEFGGQTSCYVFRRADYALVVDCGTGLYDAGEILSGCNKIDILITHVHYDHVLGLLSFDMFPAGAEISIYGNFEAWFGEASMDALYRPPFWPVYMRAGKYIATADDGVQHILSDAAAFSFHTADHPNSASIVCLELSGKKVCIFADCEHPGKIPEEAVTDCRLLIYDGMFDAEQQRLHPGWGHSSWNEGCELAQRVKPELLLITHHDPKNDDDILRRWEQSARTIYSGTAFARAGDMMII